MKKSFKAIITAAIVTLSAALTATVCTADEQVLGTAEAEALGTVTVAIEKLTLGQGFLAEPVNVPFYDGDTGNEIMERAAKATAKSYYEYEDTEYSYISGFSDETSGLELNIPEAITTALTESGTEIGTRAEDGWLKEFDITATGGYVYFINDVYPPYSISDYAPVDGDVIRFAYTLYGYGADCGIDNSEWGGAAAVMPALNRSGLTKLTANAAENPEAYAIGIAALSDSLATQETLDKAYDEILTLMNSNESAPTDEIETPESTDTAEKGSPDTGIVEIASVIAVAGLAGVIMSRKRK